MKHYKSIITAAVIAILGITAGAGLKFYSILHTKSEDILGTLESSIDSGRCGLICRIRIATKAAPRAPPSTALLNIRKYRTGRSYAGSEHRGDHPIY